MAQVTADAGHTRVAVEGARSQLGGREEGREKEETTSSIVWGQKVTCFALVGTLKFDRVSSYNEMTFE